MGGNSDDARGPDFPTSRPSYTNGDHSGGFELQPHAREYKRRGRFGWTRGYLAHLGEDMRLVLPSCFTFSPPRVFTATPRFTGGSDGLGDGQSSGLPLCCLPLPPPLPFPSPLFTACHITYFGGPSLSVVSRFSVYPLPFDIAVIPSLLHGRDVHMTAGANVRPRTACKSEFHLRMGTYHSDCGLHR